MAGGRALPAGPDAEARFVGRYLAPLAAGLPGAFGLLDDAAALSPSPGDDVVATLDTLVEGVHFLFDASTSDARRIALKALAVNVSDLAAKGARPYAYLLSLSLPDGFEHWFEGFAAGLGEGQRRWSLSLAGGDTTRSPGGFVVSITALGLVPAGRMVTRSGARAGDIVYVSGTIGEAALGLDLRLESPRAALVAAQSAPQAVTQWLARHATPEPRLALAPLVLDHATAAMDVSDGLVLDLDRLARASGCGASLEAARVPVSPPARRLVASGVVELSDLLTGGDDYEILATVAPENAALFEASAEASGVAVTAIGTMRAGAGVDWLGTDGTPLAFARRGYQHVDG
ncbi:MAG: thiamine-phosphate kinase [Hyphomicrobiaceae bacterium]|nr:thiamine-phosphate kinase [Hyphomicrobiaceae bacterium]